VLLRCVSKFKVRQVYASQSEGDQDELFLKDNPANPFANKATT